MHCWKIKSFLVQVLETSKKPNFSGLFCSEYKYIFFIFTDKKNVPILHLSCNVKKKSKTTAKFYLKE
jgi:hypothetical protein